MKVLAFSKHQTQVTKSNQGNYITYCSRSAQFVGKPILVRRIFIGTYDHNQMTCTA